MKTLAWLVNQVGFPIVVSGFLIYLLFFKLTALEDAVRSVEVGMRANTLMVERLIQQSRPLPMVFTEPQQKGNSK